MRSPVSAPPASGDRVPGGELVFWQSVLAADFNPEWCVGMNDLNGFNGAFFTGDPAADSDNSGRVSPQHINFVLKT